MQQQLHRICLGLEISSEEAQAVIGIFKPMAMNAFLAPFGPLVRQGEANHLCLPPLPLIARSAPPPHAHKPLPFLLQAKCGQCLAKSLLQTQKTLATKQSLLLKYRAALPARLPEAKVRQLESNLGLRPSLNRTGGPRQLESNRLAVVGRPLL